MGSLIQLENGLEKGDCNRWNKSYEEAVCYSLLWPENPNPLVRRDKNKSVTSSSRKDLDLRLTRLHSCLVGRITGQQMSLCALRIWEKRA